MGGGGVILKIITAGTTANCQQFLCCAWRGIRKERGSIKHWLRQLTPCSWTIRENTINRELKVSRWQKVIPKEQEIEKVSVPTARCHTQTCMAGPRTASCGPGY